MEEEFYYLLMKKCPDLKYLDMEVIKHQIFYFPEAKARFESLCKLICYTSIDSSYFYGLSRCCQNIQTLIVTNVNPNLNNGIVKLIEVQKNLNHIEWKDDFYDAHFTIDDDPYKNLLLTLEKKAENLSYLKIFFHYLENYEHYLFQMILPRFYKLKTLAIGGYLFFTQDQLNQLKMTVFNKLEMIRIDYNEFNRLDFISSIIENSGENLKKIVFRPNDIDHELYKYNEYSLNFIRKIYENCPSIEYLSIMLSPSKQHLAEFENLLKKCQNLKSLLLVIYNTDRAESYEKIFKNGEILLKILIRSAPPNFKEIRFYDEFKFSLESLEDFLRAWKGRPALSIITSDSIYEGINYKVLINKYKSYGVIKDFEYILFEDDIDYDF
ncbi:hypothetical protein GLOIN_2v1764020 [Rhizophagus clarus]|nr:hypothetical protein GLOIN_2v1764020 [Rhizophagus clarus]